MNKGCYSQLDTCETVSTLTSALKLFLRELRQPLISREIIDPPMVETPELSANLRLLRKGYNIQEEIVVQVKNIIMLLPSLEHGVLQYILLHLKRVADNEQNKMDAWSLAVIFGQNLVESKPLENQNIEEVMVDTDCNNKLVEILITHVEEFFQI